MNLTELAQQSWQRVHEFAVVPVAEFYAGLGGGERTVFFVLLGLAVLAGFLFGRRWAGRDRRRRRRRIQNEGESLVSQMLGSRFAPPDYHLMNHLTFRLEDGTTQVDHVLVSRFGVFVIETKHYKGWLFANVRSASWTQVLFKSRFKFQNPIRQNLRHVIAVRDLLDFIPSDAVRSVVVFTGEAEFKTEIPEGVIRIDDLPRYVEQHATEVMSLNEMQLCVGRLETARLEISGKTDVEHALSLARRHSGR